MPARAGPAGKRAESAIVAALGRRSIVLVGMMGAGKSSVGRRLAARLGMPFVDADTEIEAAAGMTIPEIFSIHGEAYFRAGEARVIARLLDGGPQVLATGGGAFMNPDTRAAIRVKGISIWLKADFEVLLRRVKRRTDRPLLQDRRSRRHAAAADRGALSGLCRGRRDHPLARRAARAHRRGNPCGLAAHLGMAEPARGRRR